ncbi:MAG: LysR family transcriptional regulator, partial [Candidatus Syntrophonatronum acetioxidans]
GDTSKIVRMLLAEDIHVGVVGARVERKRLKAKKFMEDEIVLIMPQGHPLAEKEKIYPSDLIQDNLIWREKGSGTRKVVEEKLLKAGISLDALEPVLELGSTQSIITAVEAGLGISLVSLWAVKKEQALKKLVVKNIEGVPLKRDLFFLYPREQYLPRSAVVLLDFIDKYDIKPFLNN